MHTAAKASLIAIVIFAAIGLAVYGGIASSKPAPDQGAKVAEVRGLLDQWQGDSGLLDSVKSRLDAILQADPNNAEAHREYARYYIMSGGGTDSDLLAAAEVSLNKAIKLKPDFVDAHVLGGHLYLQQGNPAKARASLERADAIGTEDPWLQLNWAALLLEEMQLKEASDRYQKVIDSKTTNAKAMRAAYSGMIEFWKTMGINSSVDRTYRQLIEYDPGSAWSHGNYAAFLLCTTDNPDKAIVEYRKALELMDYGMARGGLASALYRKWADRTLTKGIVPTVQSAEFDEAQRLTEGTPLEVATTYCCSGPVVEAVARVDTGTEPGTIGCGAQ